MVVRDVFHYKNHCATAFKIQQLYFFHSNWDLISLNIIITFHDNCSILSID